MTVQSTQGPAPADRWEADDEIDLRKYIDILLKRWREILFFTVLIVILAAAAVLTLRAVGAPMYEAGANVAIVRTQTDVNFDERFTTSSDSNRTQDVTSRRAALVGLAKSGTIAEAVIADLGDQLPEILLDPARLLRRIDASLSTQNGRTGQSDLIEITAEADSPEVAAAIANSWAKHYVQEVNRIYGQVPDEMMASVEQELNQAQTKYGVAQSSLESFLATTPLNTLRRQVTETQESIRILQAANGEALNNYVKEVLDSYRRIVSTYLDAQTSAQILGFRREQQGQRELLDAYMRAYSDAMVDSFATQAERDQKLVRLYYDQWLRTVAGLSTARTLQSSLEAGGDGAVVSTASALQLLKLQLVTGLSDSIPSMQQSLLAQFGNVETINQNAPVVPGNTNNTAIPPVVNVQSVQPPATNQPYLPNQPTYQIQLDPPADATLEDVSSDLSGVIQGLETQLAVLETAIADFNRDWLSGDSYDGLNASVPDESALVEAIRTQYPDLFQGGVFSAIADAAAQTSTLADMGQTQGGDLLRLAGEETLALSDEANAPMADTLTQLESRLQTLQSQLEGENARNQQFVQQRDLTWETFRALSTKQAELVLERAAANSEVRMGTPAVAPDRPVPGVSLTLSVALAGVVGLLFAIFLAFLLEYLGKKPLFTRSAPAS
ncbi:MAG: hypothetical protein KDD91_23475 [Caldilinea sp.]|nr:hypothetical protein [Caldilinea sp.]MCB0040862.1 hypothetical protein [Caldilinea sp.]MCB0152554.1 hypothetical protein [Caldilineaceae bacterium]